MLQPDIYFSDLALVISKFFPPSSEMSRLDRKSDKVQLFSVKTGHSYSCKSELVLLSNDTYLEFNHERIQAFNLTNNQFGPRK